MSERDGWQGLLGASAAVALIVAVAWIARGPLGASPRAASAQPRDSSGRHAPGNEAETHVRAISNAFVARLIGLDRLNRRLGSRAPTGRGIVTAHVEGGPHNYMPRHADSAFDGVMLVGHSGDSRVSSHAHATARVVYGPSGLAPGIGLVYCFTFDDFLGEGYLRTGFALPPVANRIRLFSHSWIGRKRGGAETVLRRMDHAADEFDVVSVVGVDNGRASPVPPLLASAYNVISVGEWHGDSSGGDTRVEKKGRCKPDIVAPGSSTSFAVPAVTASAARLLETADGLDRPAARQAEVIKAVLLAGAAKTKTWTRHDEKPLDDHFGAGRLDVDTSHRILTGVAPVDGRIPGGLGWHFGRIGPGEAKSWPFELDGDAGEVSLVLVWHRRIFGRNVVEYPKGRMRWSDAPRVADLDLGLAVAGAAPPVTVARSVSRVDNVEHVYLKRLDAGAYEIEISRTDTLSEHWDFALAWRIDDAPGGDDAARGEAQPIPGSSRVHAQ